MGSDVPVKRVILAAMFLVGCAWKGPMAAQTWPGVEVGDSVITLDKAAYKLVAVQAEANETLPDGRLKVKLELANLSALDLPVQIQTLFRDANGMLLGDATPFEMQVLPGNASALYETTSLAPGAASFTVQIKTP